MIHNLYRVYINGILYTSLYGRETDKTQKVCYRQKEATKPNRVGVEFNDFSSSLKFPVVFTFDLLTLVSFFLLLDFSLSCKILLVDCISTSEVNRITNLIEFDLFNCLVYEIPKF